MKQDYFSEVEKQSVAGSGSQCGARERRKEPSGLDVLRKYATPSATAAQVLIIQHSSY